LERAIAACRGIVDKSLEAGYRPGISAKGLYDHYVSFGDDPFIVVLDGADERAQFSAWSYAKERCRVICQERSPMPQLAAKESADELRKILGLQQDGEPRPAAAAARGSVFPVATVDDDASNQISESGELRSSPPSRIDSSSTRGEDREASRAAIVVALVAYFAVALASAAFIEFGNATPSISMTARFAGIVSDAAAQYALSGILPLLLWAGFRFKAEEAHGPIILWGILGAVFLYFTYHSEMAFRRLAENGRAEFIEKLSNACVRRQTDSALNKKEGITRHQLNAYCRCYANSLSALATTSELRNFAQNGSAPSGFENKVQQAAGQCVAVIDDMN
jgi:hypothetical protein